MTNMQLSFIRGNLRNAMAIVKCYGVRNWIQWLVVAESFSIPCLAVSSLGSKAAAFSTASRSAPHHSSAE
jgi:hypothetical protein